MVRTSLSKLSVFLPYYSFYVVFAVVLEFRFDKQRELELLFVKEWYRVLVFEIWLLSYNLSLPFSKLRNSSFLELLFELFLLDLLSFLEYLLLYFSLRLLLKFN